MATDPPAQTLLTRVAEVLDLDLERAPTPPVRPVPLPSRLATGELAWASITAALLAGTAPTSGRAGARVPSPDPDRIAVAYRSDRVLQLDGAAPSVWSPLSGFWQAADGWVRTHGNYPHHAAALRAGLGLPDAADAESVRAAIAAASASDVVGGITRAGGLAVHVRREDPAEDARLREHPLVALTRLDGAGARRSPAVADDAEPPLRGIRVLDLTRVIAGPVATRTLALLGADVLRIDPPGLPEPEWQHLDTGHGKRSALLDARAPELAELLAQADVVVLGYRPSGLARLGLDPSHLAERHPGLVIAQLSAWGDAFPERRGFDSLVQAESGIALVESPDGSRPGALPAQALDHSAGYLLAAGVCTALRHRRERGGTWLVTTSLRRVAAELLGMPRQAEPGPTADIDESAHAQTFRVGGGSFRTARSALPGFEFSPPRPWGRDPARW